METVNNLTAAASRAIFGEPAKTTATNETGGQEPVSGQTGDVVKGEPYDKGNEEPSSTTTDLPSHPKPASELPSTAAHTSPVPAADDTSKTAVTLPPNDSAILPSEYKPIPSNDTSAAEAIAGGGADLTSTTATTQKEDSVSKETPASTTTTSVTEPKKDAEVVAKLDEPEPKSLDGGPNLTGTGGSKLHGDSAVTGTSESTVAKAEDPLPVTKGSSGETASKKPSEGSPSKDGGKEKLSLKDKIKAKLHHNKH